MTPALLSLSFSLAGLLAWLAYRLLRSYLSEGWPGHAFASAALMFGAVFCLSLFWSVL